MPTKKRKKIRYIMGLSKYTALVREKGVCLPCNFAFRSGTPITLRTSHLFAVSRPFVSLAAKRQDLPSPPQKKILNFERCEMLFPQWKLLLHLKHRYFFANREKGRKKPAENGRRNSLLNFCRSKRAYSPTFAPVEKKKKKTAFLH